jgi:hypothetical protein
VFELTFHLPHSIQARLTNSLNLHHRDQSTERSRHWKDLYNTNNGFITWALCSQAFVAYSVNSHAVAALAFSSNLPVGAHSDQTTSQQRITLPRA